MNVDGVLFEGCVLVCLYGWEEGGARVRGWGTVAGIATKVLELEFYIFF